MLVGFLVAVIVLLVWWVRIVRNENKNLLRENIELIKFIDKIKKENYGKL